MSAIISANIPITNPGAAPRKVTIPAGMLIEVQTPGMQSVVVAKTVETEILGNSTQTVAVEVYCVNRDLTYPHKAKGHLTKSSFVPPINGQQGVWTAMQQPAKREESMFVGLRREMVDRLRTFEAFRMFVGDHFDLSGDDIAGDTITAKCFHLIEHCRSDGIVNELIDHLRAEYPRSSYFAEWTAEPPVRV